jgi:hypothetical protein
VFVDDFRIGSLGYGDWHAGQEKDGSKKRSRPRHLETQEEPTDEVTLSSAGDGEEQPPGYLPASPGEEPK